MKDRDERAVVAAYYNDLFCRVSDTSDLESRVSNVVSEGWKCLPTPIGGEGVRGLADTLRFFAEFAPDLRYVPQEILQAGDRYIVRSVVTGTPRRPFLGVEPRKSFQVNAIDIHRVVGGRIVQTYRVEDWARAINQISGRAEPARA